MCVILSLLAALFLTSFLSAHISLPPPLFSMVDRTARVSLLQLSPPRFRFVGVATTQVRVVSVLSLYHVALFVQPSSTFKLTAHTLPCSKRTLCMRYAICFFSAVPLICLLNREVTIQVVLISFCDGISDALQ
jgi:hypothetical protein